MNDKIYIARAGDIQTPACRIFGAGELSPSDALTNKRDLIIAADGGLLHLQRLGIAPRIIIGDFDSLDGVPEPSPGVEIIRRPVEKDLTDMSLAADEGFERGFDMFVLYGGTGGARLSHTLANISLLARLCERGAQGFLVGAGAELTVIKNGKISYGAHTRGSVSVFAIGGLSRGVSITGLKYEARDIALTESFPLGVSNSFIGTPASIEVTDGCCLIVREEVAE
ncbi:MAG: thiamine diphosphokinase [Oscillospiraceae bacterium]|jgi:thiamine pyrophosphokinase|nr:thiamine diphosphokinase [Oscillospiraceae bacterium]